MNHAWLRKRALLVEKLDRMVKAGRLSEEEAERLRAAATSDELDEAAREIQLGHARTRVAAAVEDGSLTQDEARAMFDRLDQGEDPRFLRGVGRRPRHGRAKDG